MTLAALNDAPVESADAALERCCGAREWVQAMLAERPFADREALHDTAERTWWNLSEPAWREAYTHHPRLGDVASLREKFASTAGWAGAEQAGAAAADERTLAALAEGNRAYEQRFGHRFIVCATGLTAAAMLARLGARYANGPAEELRTAAEEQMKITHLRLDKLLEEGG